MTSAKYYAAHKDEVKQKASDAYYADHEGIKQSKREYQRNFRTRPGTALARRNYSLKKYGLTLESYEALYVQQQGLCAICCLPPKPDTCLAVDHCHTTGKVRGLLCNQCNHALGNFKDNTETLRRAIEYLER